jgi:hypothetical protein
MMENREDDGRLILRLILGIYVKMLKMGKEESELLVLN